MTKTEEIAQWLESLHCDHWDEDSIGCYKSNCMLFRKLANEIRENFDE